MIEYGTEKATAMAKTVGVPCGITCQLLLDGFFLSLSLFFFFLFFSFHF